MPGSAVGDPAPPRASQPRLGGHQDRVPVAAPALQRLGDQPLVVAPVGLVDAVRVGGVDQPHACLQRGGEHGERVVAVWAARRGQAHRPEADAADRDARELATHRDGGRRRRGERGRRRPGRRAGGGSEHRPDRVVVQLEVPQRGGSAAGVDQPPGAVEAQRLRLLAHDDLPPRARRGVLHAEQQVPVQQQVDERPDLRVGAAPGEPGGRRQEPADVADPGPSLGRRLQPQPGAELGRGQRRADDPLQSADALRVLQLHRADRLLGGRLHASFGTTGDGHAGS